MLTTSLLRRIDKEGLPIVAAELHTLIGLSHYAPSDIASHLVYLADPSTARRFLGYGSLDSAVLELVGPWFHMRAVPFGCQGAISLVRKVDSLSLRRPITNFPLCK